MHPLDNPIWTALKTTHARFAESSGGASRFQPEISTLAAFAQPTPPNYESLASLVSDKEVVGMFFFAIPDPPVPWRMIASGSLVQMVHEGGGIPARTFGFEKLTEQDVPEMLALVELTQPGPFSRRTHELGHYLGLRVDGRLAAMAGERLRLPGYTEISAVCTHPDFLGRGYATALIAVQAERIRGRGETPFLHVKGDNAHAIKLYEHLGFTQRLRSHYAILRKNETAAP